MLPLTLALVALAGLHALHRIWRVRATTSPITTVLDHHALPGGAQLSWLRLGEREVVVITHRGGAQFHELRCSTETLKAPEPPRTAWANTAPGFDSRLAS